MGEMKSWWLRHACSPKPVRVDRRPFLVRLAASLRLVVRGSLKKGLTYLGVKGGAEF